MTWQPARLRLNCSPDIFIKISKMECIRSLIVSAHYSQKFYVQYSRNRIKIDWELTELSAMQVGESHWVQHSGGWGRSLLPFLDGHSISRVNMLPSHSVALNEKLSHRSIKILKWEYCDKHLFLLFDKILG